MNSNDVNPEELKFSLIKDPNKRADLQVMEYTEKNKSDQRMYGQLIDVLHKQIDIAFESDEAIKENAKNGVNWRFEGVEAEQKKVDELTAQKKELHRNNLRKLCAFLRVPFPLMRMIRWILRAAWLMNYQSTF